LVLFDFFKELNQGEQTDDEHFVANLPNNNEFDGVSEILNANMRRRNIEGY
jgi:hypothetical protein